MSMRPDEIKSTTQFDSIAESYASNYKAHTPSGHSFRARLSKAHALLGHGFLGRLLDVGGASGIYFQELKSQVESYHIIDISRLMIDSACKINSGKIPLFCYLASAYELPFSDLSFETILAMGMFEYLNEPWQALAEISRIAKPGAVILASFPNAHSPMRRLSKLIYQCCRRATPFGRLFTIQEVCEAAAKLKLQKLCIGGYNAQLVPFPLTWRLSWLAYILAVLLEPLLNRYGCLWGTAFIVKFRK